MNTYVLIGVAVLVLWMIISVLRTMDKPVEEQRRMGILSTYFGIYIKKPNKVNKRK
jgi:surface polysaccharide O-acyltransferase-like enzyme